MTQESKPEKLIIVSPTLRSPHELIAVTKKHLAGKVPIRLGNGLVHLNEEGCLDVLVSPAMQNRALRILDALFKSIEERGFQISVERSEQYRYGYSNEKQSTRITLLGENISFRLKERIRREEIPEDEKKYSYPRYDYSPSGVLVFEITTYIYGKARTTWADGKVKKLEGRLNEIMTGLIQAAAKERAWRLEREREKRESAEREQQRQEMLKKMRAEETKLKDLLTASTNWHRSQELRQYIKSVSEKEQAQRVAMSEEMREWIDWANQQADRLDPLVESPPSILDEDE